MQHSIIWPDQYTPGVTDNYVSNEVIIPNLEAAQVWKYLADTTAWPQYYKNASDISFHDNTGPVLSGGVRFKFVTFGFHVEAEVVEYEEPKENKPGRVAWHGWVEGDDEQRLDVHHAWLVENVANGCVRILTQETQIGKPAITLRETRPNPMLNAHQDWLDGLVLAAQGQIQMKGMHHEK